jgi:hypothetical protein
LEDDEEMGGRIEDVLEIVKRLKRRARDEMEGRERRRG